MLNANIEDNQPANIEVAQYWSCSILKLLNVEVDQYWRPILKSVNVARQYWSRSIVPANIEVSQYWTPILNVPGASILHINIEHQYWKWRSTFHAARPYWKSTRKTNIADHCGILIVVDWRSVLIAQYWWLPEEMPNSSGTCSWQDYTVIRQYCRSRFTWTINIDFEAVVTPVQYCQLL